MTTMKIWGMLSSEDEKSGFDLVLDDKWFVVLKEKGAIMARFDPRDYTSIELQDEVEKLLMAKRVPKKRR